MDVKDKIKINEEPVEKSPNNKRNGNTGGAALPDGDIFEDAITELDTLAEFLRSKGFVLNVRRTPFGSEVYGTCVVICRASHGVGIVINVSSTK